MKKAIYLVLGLIGGMGMLLSVNVYYCHRELPEGVAIVLFLASIILSAGSFSAMEDESRRQARLTRINQRLQKGGKA